MATYIPPHLRNRDPAPAYVPPNRRNRHSFQPSGAAAENSATVSSGRNNKCPWVAPPVPRAKQQVGGASKPNPQHPPSGMQQMERWERARERIPRERQYAIKPLCEREAHWPFFLKSKEAPLDIWAGHPPQWSIQEPPDWKWQPVLQIRFWDESWGLVGRPWDNGIVRAVLLGTHDRGSGLCRLKLCGNCNIVEGILRQALDQRLDPSILEALAQEHTRDCNAFQNGRENTGAIVPIACSNRDLLCCPTTNPILVSSP